MGKINNIDMLNSIREQQNLEYQSLIPKVSSQDDCLQVLATFESYPTTKNAFINTLTNRIGKSLFFDKVFNNPYKMLHKGMLPFGKSVEQLFVEMAEQKNFADHFTGSTTQEGDLIKAVPPSVKVDYISQNYQYKFKTSISDQQLRGAFQSEFGLSELIMHCVDSLMSAVQYSEYVDMKKLINTTLVANMKKETVSGLVAKELTKKIRILADKMTFPSTVYNTAGVRQWSNKQDLVLFTTPEVKAELDVELLAQAFNVSKADIPVRVIVMDELPAVATKEVYAILADKDLIQCYDTINTTSSFYNGEQMTTNYFAHKHGIMAGCQFAQAVAITKA